jgi:hypothetical protein
MAIIALALLGKKKITSNPYAPTWPVKIF